MLNYEYDADAERRALIKEGREEGIIEVARNMLSSNMDILLIMKFTGLQKVDILELKKEMNIAEIKQ